MAAPTAPGPSPFADRFSRLLTKPAVSFLLAVLFVNLVQWLFSFRFGNGRDGFMTVSHPKVADVLNPCGWVQETLGLREDVASPESRSALFDRIRETSFCPPHDWAEGLRIAALEPAARPSSTLFPEFAAARREALKRLIERFARQFFKMEPEARQAEYEWLRFLVTPEPELRWRLKLLRPGLALTQPPGLPIQTRQAVLIALMSEIVVATPQERSRLRNRFLASIERDEALAWKEAARELSSLHPDWAAIDSGLIRELRGDQKKPIVPRPRPQPIPQTPRTESSGLGPWFILASVLFGLLRIFTSPGAPRATHEPVRLPVPPIQTAAPESQIGGSTELLLELSYRRSLRVLKRDVPPDMILSPGIYPHPSTRDRSTRMLPLIRKIVEDDSLSPSIRQTLARNYVQIVRKEFGSDSPDYFFTEEMEAFVDLGIISERLREALDEYNRE